MRKTSIYCFRDNLARYLNEVVTTEIPLVVCKFNKPIAVVMPAKKELINEDYNKFFGFLEGKESSGQFLKRVRRNKKERSYIEFLRK